ncbi:YbhN family protein [Zhouia sp. PK063]|uniref:YbhN family protein n=1 Tax=Zhouia sp. PK063 TaxID=3373602 RepID=UPI0037901F55
MNLKSKLIQVIKITLPLLLGVFLIVYTYHKFTPEQLEEIKKHFKSADYFYVGLSIFFGFLSHLSRAYRWNFMLEPLGYKPKLMNNIMAIGSGYLLNLAIPRSGEVFRAAVIKKYDNVPFEKAFGTIVAERIADLVILLVIISSAFLLEFNTLKSFLLQHIQPQKLLILLVIAIAVFGLFVLYLTKTSSAIGLKIKNFVSGLKDGVFSIVTMKKKWPFILHTIFIWVMYVLMFYICIFAFPETSHITFSEVLTAFTVGSLTIAFTNGGFGSYPFLVAQVLDLFGIAFTIGTAFGWIVWISQTLMVIIFGGLSFLFLPVYNRLK